MAYVWLCVRVAFVTLTGLSLLHTGFTFGFGLLLLWLYPEMIGTLGFYTVALVIHVLVLVSIFRRWHPFIMFTIFSLLCGFWIIRFDYRTEKLC
jgi:hypothetical protein